MWREQWRVCERGGVNRRRRRRASNPFSGINGAERYPILQYGKSTGRNKAHLREETEKERRESAVL